MGVGQRKRRKSNNNALVQFIGNPKEEEKFRYIAEEIVLDILSALPVKSLLRLRCVSKQWAQLISQIITRVRKVLIPCKPYYSYASGGYYTFRSIDQNYGIEDLHMNIPGGKKHETHIHGSCNGLLLIGLGGDFLLWNPSISRSVSRWQSIYYPNRTSKSGLCFDSSTCSYKFVMVSRSYRRGQVTWEATVGCFKTRIRRKVKFPYENIDLYRFVPVLNNQPYWWRYSSPHKPCDIIVYFDPNMDEFFDLPLPSLDPMDDNFRVIEDLGILDGRLCMSRTFEDTDITKVFVMEKHSVKKSWALLFKLQIRHVESVFSAVPLFFRDEKKREVLIYYSEHSSGKIVAYDIDTNVYKEISVGYVGNRRVSLVMYEETLIRPTWRKAGLPSSMLAEEGRIRPTVVWNVKKDETQEELKVIPCYTYSSIDAEETAIQYLELQDRHQSSKMFNGRVW